MLATPTIPRWIHEFKHPGYTNVFALYPETSRIYATETLFPDWGAETLLLAKDAAPSNVIGDLGWRHAVRGDPGGWRTNERLEKLAKLIPGSKLYGSSTANMLYDDPRWSRSLPDFWGGDLHQYLIRVLQWVIASMPNVRAIACLGAESWYLVASAMNIPEQSRNWVHYRDNSTLMTGIISGKSVIATAHYHPAARKSNLAIESGWKTLAEALRAPV